ncbi:MAG: hypothetical protein JWP29_4353, partial [Rhodoferax sp.]|nr:hypothetical protein [Rhodoferax sp.]
MPPTPSADRMEKKARNTMKIAKNIAATA